MENFNFYAPTYFAFGKDRENDAGQLEKDSEDQRSSYTLEAVQ